MNRTVFIVDGFNLYHSLVEASRDSGGKSAKWLDVRKLCASFLPVVGKAGGEWAELQRIHYFSASPTHRSPAKIARHALYMRCLRATGIHVELGRFKRKTIYCRRCRRYTEVHEEKETDVAMAAKLFEVCLSDECESIVLMSGDTDLGPAFASCKRLFPEKLILFGFPYNRTNTELARATPGSFSIKRRSCFRNQFQDPLVLPGGTEIRKPAEW